jgi:hypothetical protein
LQVISGDHPYYNTCSFTIADGLRHFGSQRILKLTVNIGLVDYQTHLLILPQFQIQPRESNRRSN